MKKTCIRSGYFRIFHKYGISERISSGEECVNGAPTTHMTMVDLNGGSSTQSRSPPTHIHTSSPGGVEAEARLMSMRKVTGV